MTTEIVATLGDIIVVGVFILVIGAGLAFIVSAIAEGLRRRKK